MDYKPAISFKEAYENLQEYPLEKGSRDPRWVDLSEARGYFIQSKLKKMLIELKSDGNIQLALVCARGSGKSTEFFHFLNNDDVKTKFFPIYFEYNTQLDPNHLEYSDLIMYLSLSIEEKMRKEGMPLDSKLLEAIADWFSEVTKFDKKTVDYSLGISAKAEAGVTLPFFAKFLAALTSTIKVDSEHQKEIRRKIKVYPDLLINNLNLLLKDAKDKLKIKNNKELLIIIDNLDRYHPSEVANLMIEEGDLLKRIRTNIIYTPPLQLYHLTQRQGESLQSKWDFVILPLPKIKNKEGTPYPQGINKLREVILKRIDQSLFENPALIEKFIDKSGGNIRDLMRILRYACEEARSEKIDEESFNKAIQKLKNGYKAEIPGNYYPHLVEVGRKKSIDDPNEITIDALFHRYILKYNDEEWYDVHPIIKEIETYKEIKKATE